jgi:nucleolar protein 56
MYARCVQLIKDRQQLSEEMADALEEIIMDSAKVQAIFDASKSSMGM